MPRLTRSAPPSRLPSGGLVELVAIWLDEPFTPGRFWNAAESSETLAETHRRLRDGGVPRAPFLAAAEREMARAAASGTNIVAFGGEGYPAALLTLPDPPPLLWVRGALAPLEDRVVAIVGARKASAYGRSVARRLGSEFAECGVVVVSGLARGVDVEAHAGACERGGATWAVLGSGLDAIYPPEHREHARRIARTGGAVVSEFPLSAPPLPANFPRRNRIIAGLAAAVVVVEARRRSGSLITAEFAMDQGKEVGAVPGPAAAPESEGTHALLRDGVVLVERAADVLNALSAPWAAEAAPRLAGRPAEPGTDRGTEAPSPESLAVWRALGPLPRGVDDIASELGLEASLVRATLVRLSLAGRAREHPGSLYGRATGSP